MKSQFPTLAKRGPHHVLTGDLAFAGLPGRVYAPEEGSGLPAIAFGHDWRTPVAQYHATLRHLASWGFVVAAPDTELGAMPNHRGFANDLESTLQILAGVKLGTGNITVNPKKLLLAGHGMGAGCAVLAAAGRDHIRGVAALYPAVTSPSSYDAAKNVEVPGLVVAAGEDEIFDRGNPPRLATNWAGDVVYRKVKDAGQHDFSESPMWRRLLGFSSSNVKTQEQTRALLAGWAKSVTGDKDYADFAEWDAKAKGVESLSLEEVRELLPENKKTGFGAFPG
ncbi:dienelactone hydrolase family protein [Corynebacterium ulceribovis]|uniref:dienelactone hydrolase family protein n=1 Tax=Corynebacterium ulceribovis TaxID=487732 RepID=UPI00037D5474|nr:dienelactone hydrolase family protein [Corynebacterium ulceribovis]